jgi:hypothetical protein
LNEQKLLLATATFWKAQAPGDSLTVLAEADERLIAATAPAIKASLTIDIPRILDPLSQHRSAPPHPSRDNILHCRAKDASHFARQIDRHQQKFLAKPKTISDDQRR